MGRIKHFDEEGERTYSDASVGNAEFSMIDRMKRDRNLDPDMSNDTVGPTKLMGRIADQDEKDKKRK